MVFMDDFVAVLIPIAVTLVFGLVCSVIVSRGFPSAKIFLVVFAIGMGVLTYKEIVPEAGLALSALALAAMWFGGRGI